MSWRHSIGEYEEVSSPLKSAKKRVSCWGPVGESALPSPARTVRVPFSTYYREDGMSDRSIDRRLRRWMAIGEVAVAGGFFIFIGLLHLSEKLRERHRRADRGSDRDDTKG